MSEYKLRRDAGGSTDLDRRLVSGTPLHDVRPLQQPYDEAETGPMFTARVEGHGIVTLFADEIEEVES